MTRHFYDHTIVIKRLKNDTGNRRHLVATATADASIQPLGKDGTILDEGLFGSAYIAYVEIDTPAIKGDQVVDSDGIVYAVTEVNVRDHGSLAHKEVILKRQSSTE